MLAEDTKRRIWDKLLIALGLIGLSAAAYAAHYYFFRDLKYITNYVFLHLSFLPIHALVLGLILDELISYREKASRRRKLNLYLGIFFRQMGSEIFLSAANMAENRKDLDALMSADQSWGKARFRRAREEVAHFPVEMRADAVGLIKLLDLLREHEPEIIAQTRNPMLMEFEDLYRCLLSLFHIIEEMQYRRPVPQMAATEVAHLAKDAGKSLLQLGQLWLGYMEHLKKTHPVLFGCQVGICSMMEPLEPED